MKTTKSKLNKSILASRKRLFEAPDLYRTLWNQVLELIRLFYAALEYAYGIKDDRVVMSFPRSIAPIQVGVYPLMSKDGLDTKALQVQRMLAGEGFMAELDEAGSIGRRYARADESGVQLGITIDYDTLKDEQ